MGGVGGGEGGQTELRGVNERSRLMLLTPRVDTTYSESHLFAQT